jgi:hypothetical protein
MDRNYMSKAVLVMDMPDSCSEEWKNVNGFGYPMENIILPIFQS